MSLWPPKQSRYDSHPAYELIGKTPMVKLTKIPKEYGLKCNFYAKCEFMNIAGSVKDRIALGMFRDAQKNEVVDKNTIFIEPTSGNTGIAIAYVAALEDNQSIIVTRQKNSDEKINTMRLLGANVIQLKDSANEMATARKLMEKYPDRIVMLDQFENEVNPLTHYNTTAVEILNQVGKVHMLVLGVGSGGTLTGTAYRIKKEYENCKVVVGNPDGSILFDRDAKKHPFLVEGIGTNEPPIVMDMSLVDYHVTVTDKDAFLMARDLAKKEGLMCGGSAGLAMCAALRKAKELKLGEGENVVVILPDGIRNYMSKFVSDQWMEAQRFMSPPDYNISWWNDSASQLQPFVKPLLEVQPDFNCERAINMMKAQQTNIAVIVETKSSCVKKLLGAVSMESFCNYAANPIKVLEEPLEEFDIKEKVTEYPVKHLFKLDLSDSPKMGLIARMLDVTPFVVVGNTKKDSHCKDYFEPQWVATAEDVIKYITRRHI